MRIILLLCLFVSTVYAGEDCAQIGGICRESCAENEIAEMGAFLDCSDRQECCTKKQEPVEIKSPKYNPKPKEDKNEK